MAFYTNFESYSIGQGPPYGALKDFSGLSAAIVEGGPVGSTQCLRLQTGGLFYDDGNVYSSATLWCALRILPGQPFVGNFITFRRDLVSLVTLGVNADGSIICSASGVTSSSSEFSVLTYYDWHFIQVNCTLSDLSGFLVVTFEVAVDGVVAASLSGVTTIPISSIGTAQFNKVFIQTFNSTLELDEFTFDLIASIPSYPNPVSGRVIRVSGGAIEVNELPNDGQIYVSSGVLEVPELPNDTKIIVSQGVIELILLRLSGLGWIVKES